MIQRSQHIGGAHEIFTRTDRRLQNLSSRVLIASTCVPNTYHTHTFHKHVYKECDVDCAIAVFDPFIARCRLG